MERRRYALRLLYDGRAFRGFQRQPGLPTVQEAIEAGLTRLGVKATLEVAARTDAGVSAVDQVVSFPVRAALDPAALRRAVNEAAPEGLICLAAARAPASFHARSSALGRRYVYLVGAPPPPEVAPWCWSLPDERAFPGLAAPRLDAGAMRQALSYAVGEHDFAGFARPGEQRGSVRTVTRADVVEADGLPLYAVVLEGRGFLRAMVRNLVGTAVAAGLGLTPPTQLRDLLAARGRYRGVRAPGWGLTLASVSYPPGTLDWT
ncbi:MAG TPA: tRNA pseudouridine(38-40) synthase TruA [Anaeromyxobacteraceae bacterium]|nr:tRNA pseudouridine(38-40) synthase TruA [Anaeromyxobacteraceae bacterium]